MGFQIVDNKVINISENSTGNDNIIYHTAPVVFEACFFPVRSPTTLPVRILRLRAVQRSVRIVPLLLVVFSPVNSDNFLYLFHSLQGFQEIDYRRHGPRILACCRCAL